MDIATTHLSADLDGIASLVALRLLEPGIELGLPGSMDSVSRRFWAEEGGALPAISNLAKLRRRIEGARLGRLLVVDTASPARIGEIAAWVERFDEVLAYDTHPPADGDLPRAPMADAAACVSVLVMRLAEAGVRPSPQEAGLFLLGIHEDTGHFTFPGTRALDHRAAALCVEWGAPEEWVSRYVPKGFTSRQLGFLEAMSRSVVHEEMGGIPLKLLSLEFEEYEPDLSVLLEQLRAAEGWPAAFLLAGGGDRVDVIGRSAGAVDVAAVLRGLGGGGHPSAASAVLRGTTLHEARAILRGALEEVLERQRLAGAAAVHSFVHLPASSSIGEAAALIHQRRIDSLPLTRGKGRSLRYVGIVSRRDVDAAVHHGLGSRPVEEISAAAPQWLAPDRPIAEAREMMIAGAGRLILVGHPPGEAVGILTRGGVFRAMDEPRLMAAGEARQESSSGAAPWSLSKQPGAGASVSAPPRAPSPGRVMELIRQGLGERWPLVERLGAIAEAWGQGLHLVGGTVRDLFLEAPIRDVDLMLEGEAPRLAREAARRFGGTVESHEAFGTACWIGPTGASVDLASARFEHYERPAALPTVALHAGLRQDLFRRDFTINAMAISVDPRQAGALLDPYGGLADLQAGRLRVLHGLSFHDDPTRAFRAARFAARLDFELAPETLGLLGAARRAGAFEKLGRERLGAELDRILGESAAVQAFRLLRGWRLLHAIHPRFSGSRGFIERLGKARTAAHRVEGLWGEGAPSQAQVLWIALASAIPRGEREPLDRMVPGGSKLRRALHRGPEKARGVVRSLAKATRGSDVAALLETLEPAELVYALALATGEDEAQWIEWWIREGRAIRSSVNGDRLLALGYRQGPSLKRALDAARAAARDGLDDATQLAVAKAALQAGR